MKALIVYGTRYGTAEEIAHEIAHVIKEEGIETDLTDSRRMKDCDVSPYDLVIVGSGIKIGKWTKGSLKFLKKNRSKLSERKVALFVTCGAANEEKTIPEGQKKYLDEVAEKNLINPPISMGLFGSVYDPKAKHGIIFNMTQKFIKKDLKKKGLDINQRIDYRNWDEIREWARNLAASLKD
jgi:menaquinone-dependent protoporphyrinogen oxidase